MGSEARDHSKIISSAARLVLRPMGVKQKGRSRTWIADHGWWVCTVEFQPSSWSRGSYLNVGCMWLWSVKDYCSFDEGDRVAPFDGFESHEQFEQIAMRLAQQAAGEVRRYRKLFPDVNKVSEFYLRQAQTISGWTAFHAGVACALSGKPKDARRFLDVFLKPETDPPDWLVAAQAEAEDIRGLVGDSRSVRHAIADRVQRTRQLQKLKKLDVVDFDSIMSSGESVD